MTDQNLVEYAKTLTQKGYSPEAIREALLKKGYTNEQVDEVLINLGKAEEKQVKVILKEWWGSKFVQGIAAGLVLLLLVIFYLSASKSGPPMIKFMDKPLDEPLIGKVYLDFKYVGDADEYGFEGVPETICEGEHIISIETNEGTFNWTTYASDCEIRKLTLLLDYAGEKSVVAREDEGIIYLNFAYEETEEPISGKLFIDDAFVGEIDGVYIMFLEECKQVKTIRLEYDSEYSEWPMNTVLCDYGEINLKVNLED